MDNLTITTENQGDGYILHCSGRLDANRAGYLNETIDRLVREGHYHICLDLEGIEYISSAGIRALVTQYKNLRAVNGHFSIPVMSENVRQVLTMVGMAGMLSQERRREETAPQRGEETVQKEIGGSLYRVSPLPGGGKMVAEFYGRPDLLKQSAFTGKDMRIVRAGSHRFAIGLGAIGDNWEECRERFGEYLLTGCNAAYLPGDGSGQPDYMTGGGQLVVSLAELYGLHFTGNFSRLVRFDSAGPPAATGFSQLASTLLQLTGYERICLVMIAESGGLIGSSLRASPVEGRDVFSYPAIKETMRFTTEPAHLRMLTLSVGYLSAGGPEEEQPFVRPLTPGSPLKNHVHTAVFSFLPLKKNDIDLEETIETLYSQAELTDILHLTNDSRNISGMGESRFIKGFCWIAPLESNVAPIQKN